MRGPHYLCSIGDAEYDEENDGNQSQQYGYCPTMQLDIANLFTYPEEQCT
jgi:hypothetical protein